jgi:hypothetical protein
MTYRAEGSISHDKKIEKAFVTPIQMYPLYYTQTEDKPKVSGEIKRMQQSRACDAERNLL